MEQTFSKILHYPKITKSGVIKTIDHHPINSRNCATAYYTTLEEVPWSLVPEKSRKQEKMANILKNWLKS